MTAKPYRIEWRPMAREDLRGIVRYIGKDNPTRAKSFGKELRDKTKPLAQHPELGRTSLTMKSWPRWTPTLPPCRRKSAHDGQALPH